MSDFTQAKKVAADLAGLLKVCETIGKMDSLEEAERQLNGRIGTAQLRLDKLNDDIKLSEESRARAVHEAALAEVELDEQANRIIAKADAKAKEIVSKAEARAKATDEATAAKHEEFARTMKEAAAAKDEMVKINTAKEALRQQL